MIFFRLVFEEALYVVIKKEALYVRCNVYILQHFLGIFWLILQLLFPCQFEDILLAPNYS